MRPARETILMHMAGLVATRSTCERLHVGAVVARDGRSLVQGYNGAPAGIDHCDHTCTCGLPPAEINGHRHLPGCPADPSNGCEKAVHAEANAIAYAARYGVTLDGTEMFVTHQPCLKCAELIINAGIMRVLYEKPYRVVDGLHLLLEARVVVEQL
jgi:dCMP deaminase